MSCSIVNTGLRHWCHGVFRAGTRAAAIVVLVVLPAGCTFGAPDLKSVAAEFTAPSSWEALGDSEVTETLCIGSGCKTVVMAWGSDPTPTAAEFVGPMQQAGWTGIEADDCEVGQSSTGPVPFCRATASSGDVHIELTAAGPLTGDVYPFVITLRVGSR